MLWYKILYEIVVPQILFKIWYTNRYTNLYGIVGPTSVRPRHGIRYTNRYTNLYHGLLNYQIGVRARISA